MNVLGVGHFGPELGGQFAPDSVGHFARILHLSALQLENDKMSTHHTECPHLCVSWHIFWLIGQL